MKRHLQEKSLEGISIIVCVRWMLFAPIAFVIVVGISIALSGLYPEPKTNTFDEHWFLPLLVVIYLSLVVRDVWLVRRAALLWEESRIRSLTIMQRLPLLLLFLVPVYLFAESPQSTGPVIEWISGMLWVFSCLSVLFYLVYFTLLLSILRLPKPSAIIGFVLVLFASISGAKDRIKAHKTSLLTPDPLRVQPFMAIQPTPRSRSRALGQA
jgi:hypothetical protein